MQTLLIATRNSGKLRELRQLLRELPFVLCDLDSFPSIQTVAETGDTFAENALLKATSYARQGRLLTLADDSGLEVDALDGAPGVRSARYAGDSASDAQRTNKLLMELSRAGSAHRTARFVSAIAVANREGDILNISIGICEGHIAHAPRGVNGFGYDPIFIPDGFEQTFGQLPDEVKNELSHRARALGDAVDFLRTLTVA